MDSEQIKNALTSNPVTKQIFRDVFASDTLPNGVHKYPAAFVVNTDVHTEEGSHWLAIYLHDNVTAEFFDSFGRPPSQFVDGKINSFLSKYKRLTYNDVALQSVNSKVCGHYVIYYIFCKCKGESMKAIVSRFSKHNDVRVYNFVSKNFVQ